MHDPTVEAIAVAIGKRSAARRETGGTPDACLCHGAAGNGHLFNRMFQATGCQEFLDAALFWFSRALEMRDPMGGVAGYRAWKPESTEEPRVNPWVDDPTFLTGASGVALAFLAATASVEPNWDRVLLSRIDSQT